MDASKSVRLSGFVTLRSNDALPSMQCPEAALRHIMATKLQVLSVMFFMRTLLVCLLLY